MVRSQSYPAGRILTGVIAERAYADLLLIDGDPTQDIRLLMDAGNIDLTMKNGVNYKDTL